MDVRRAVETKKPAVCRGLEPGTFSMIPFCQCFARRVKRPISNNIRTSPTCISLRRIQRPYPARVPLLSIIVRTACTIHSKDRWRNEMAWLIRKWAYRRARPQRPAVSGRHGPVAKPIVEFRGRQIRDGRTSRRENAARIRLIDTGETADLFGRDSPRTRSNWRFNSARLSGHGTICHCGPLPETIGKVVRPRGILVERVVRSLLRTRL
jgi:hypothetical protein